MRQSLRPTRLSDWLSLVVAATAALVAVAVVVGAVYVARTIMTVSSDPLRDVEVRAPGQSPAAGIAGLFARGERVNLLLLGYGGAGHDGAYLTDSLMVASIEPKTGVVTLLSIARDLWVTLPKSKYAASYQAKVNEAFAIPAASGDRDEGIRVADETLERVLGITIHRTLAIDFRAFRTVVDAIGGIDLTVDRSFTALYPRNDDPNIDPSWIEISFAPGAQHMNGETALRYARARYSDGPEASDFARAVRQQKVILAAKDKVVASDAFTKLFGLLDALRDNVRTDLSIADMQALTAFARRYDDARTSRAALTTANLLQSGLTAATGYALWPKVEGWSEIQAYVRRLLEHPQSFREGEEVTLFVSRQRAAIGAEAVRRLEDLGFAVALELDGGADPERTSVSDGAAGRGTESVAFLGEYFGRALLGAPNGSGSIIVRLGRDWTPPREFEAPYEEPQPEPSASPSPLPSAPSAAPTAGPTRTPRPTPTPPGPTPKKR